MKSADLSKGLTVGPEPHFDVVDSQGVVVAQAPRGIHTQVKNADWKRHARLFACVPNLVSMLQNIADQEAQRGADPQKILALVDDAIAQVPELQREPVAPKSHWDADDDYPLEDWRREVAEDSTRLGYLEWAAHQREMNADPEPPAPTSP